MQPLKGDWSEMTLSAVTLTGKEHEITIRVGRLLVLTPFLKLNGSPPTLATSHAQSRSSTTLLSLPAMLRVLRTFPLHMPRLPTIEAQVLLLVSLNLLRRHSLRRRLAVPGIERRAMVIGSRLALPLTSNRRLFDSVTAEDVEGRGFGVIIASIVGLAGRRQFVWLKECTCVVFECRTRSISSLMVIIKTVLPLLRRFLDCIVVIVLQCGWFGIVMGKGRFRRIEVDTLRPLGSSCRQRSRLLEHSSRPN